MTIPSTHDRRLPYLGADLGEQRAHAHSRHRRCLADARRGRSGRRVVPASALTRGTVVDALVDFRDVAGAFKRRPVVVIDADAHHVVVLRCTTGSCSTGRGVALIRWQDAGLARPTTVRLRPERILITDVVHLRGRLEGADRALVA